MGRMVDFLKGLSFLILPLGMGCKRLVFFEGKIKQFGGRICSASEAASKSSYVIVDESVGDNEERCVAALASFSLSVGNIRLVGSKWLSMCLSARQLVDVEPFEMSWSRKRLEIERKGVKRKSEDEGSSSTENTPRVDSEKYLCFTSSTSGEASISNQRRLIMDELQKLADAFAARNDTWRANSYRNAVSIIARQEKEIKTFNEARQIPGIGERMALKIMEIIESGKLSKVDEVVNEKTKILEMFCSIWGVGPSTAESWYQAGYRSLSDLRNSANLTKQQRIGLRLHRDLLLRMTRDEVQRIGSVVAEEAKLVVGLGRCRIELVGSYRRGKRTCGDVDVMLVHSRSIPPGDLLLHLTDRLKKKGYITNDLVNLTSDEDSHKKWMGIFKLVGESDIHRRLDLFVVPETEYASALMHYTGSAAFNRSIRLYASRKGLVLSEHGLYVDAIRKGSDILNKGQPLKVSTERDIFRHLGLEYKAPEERDH